MCANREGSGEIAPMRRLAWAFAGRVCDKYHNLMSWLKYSINNSVFPTIEVDKPKQLTASYAPIVLRYFNMSLNMFINSHAWALLEILF